ncbi:MAG: hypothetical protein ACTHU1_13310 [Arachnia sp.]
MKRRRAAGAVPNDLEAFTEAQWPGIDWTARFTAWCTAQDDHADEAGGWAAGPLDLLFRRVMVRARHQGRKLPLGVTDHFGLPPERERPHAATRQRRASQ